MLVKINDIVEMMEKIAPPMLAENWDNIGLMVGDSKSNVKKVLIALDSIDSVIDEAIDKKCQLIITHHPLIFKAVKNVTDRSALGKRLIKLIKNDISVYSAHTNLDIADGGTNDTLANLLELKNIQNLCEPVFENMGLGKIGELDSQVTFEEFIGKVKNILKLDTLTVCGNNNKEIKKVGLGTGSCGDYEYMLKAKEAGCDVYITGDIGYHDAQNAVDLDICLIDAGHYATEVIIVKELAEKLRILSEEKDFEVEIIESEIYGNSFRFM